MVGIARWLELLVLGVYVFDLTRSAALVALVALVRMSAFALFGPVAGAIGDLAGRKSQVLVSLVVGVATPAILATLILAEWAGLGVIVASAFVTGMIWVTDMPFRRRLLADCLGPEHLAAALALDNSTNNGTRMLGPLLGGIALAGLGIVGALAVMAALHLVSLVLIVGVQPPPTQADGTAQQSRFRAAMLIPPLSLLRRPLIRAVMAVTVIYNLCCLPLLGMIPVMADKDLGLGPVGAGLLSAAEGLGATLGAVGVAVMARPAWLFHYYFGGTAAFAVVLGALSLGLAPAATAIGLFAAGFSGAFYTATQYTLIYSIAPVAERGRTAGLLAVFIGFSVPGFYFAGLAFDRLGTEAGLRLMAASGLAGLFVILILWLRLDPADRRIVGS